MELTRCGELMGPKQTRELIRHLNLSVIFLPKKKKDFGGNMTNARTYLAFDLVRLELIRLGLYLHFNYLSLIKNILGKLARTY